MIDHDELARLQGAVLSDGNLWAIYPDGSVKQMTGDGASEEFRNLRNASLVMYRALSDAQNWTELLITWLEAAEAEGAVAATLNVQAAIGVCRRIAVEGLENIADNKNKR